MMTMPSDIENSKNHRIICSHVNFMSHTSQCDCNDMIEYHYYYYYYLARVVLGAVIELAHFVTWLSVVRGD